MMTFRSFAFVLALGALVSATQGWAAGESGTAADKAALVKEAQATVDRMVGKDPGLRKLVDSAAGYAVFPSVGQGAVGVGGAYGRGVVFQDRKSIGIVELAQASVGLQAGGQTYSELLIFKDVDALNRLKAGNFDLGASASAVILKTGAGAETRFEEGVAVIIEPKGGLMAGVSVSGQTFTFRPLATTK